MNNKSKSRVMLENFDPDRHCFACGADNPSGLKMQFESDGQRLYSQITVGSEHGGWRGIVHGGIVSALLDEIMSWTAIHLLQRLILTRSMEVSFRKPALVGHPLEVQGWIDQVDSDRKATMASVLVNAEGGVLAEGKGQFALLTPDTARRMNVIAPNIIDRFEAFFK